MSETVRTGRPELSTWADERPARTETDRHRIADEHASHLPQGCTAVLSDQDIDAMKAAHIRRFDEDLPRTETLFAVAHVGRRMGVRDERAVIVAWLRNLANDWLESGRAMNAEGRVNVAIVVQSIRSNAAAIERGEHQS